MNQNFETRKNASLCNKQALDLDNVLSANDILRTVYL